MPPSPLLQVAFRPPLDFYDVLIHLNPKQIPRHLEGVDRPAKSFIRGMLKSDAPVKTLSFPVVDYDPVQCYLQELRVSVAKSCGGTGLGGVCHVLSWGEYFVCRPFFLQELRVMPSRLVRVASL